MIDSEFDDCVAPPWRFSADTKAVLAFFIGGGIGAFWPFGLILLASLLQTSQQVATTGSSNWADSFMTLLMISSYFAPVALVVLMLAMFIGFVFFGFCTAFAVFIIAHLRHRR